MDYIQSDELYTPMTHFFNCKFVLLGPFTHFESPTPSLLATTNLFFLSVSLDFVLFALFFRFHIQVKPYENCLSLTSLSIIHSKYISVVTNVKILSFFMAEQYSHYHISLLFLIYSSNLHAQVVYTSWLLQIILQ